MIDERPQWLKKMPGRCQPEDEERAEVRRLPHSRTEAARLMERAQIVWLAAQGRRVDPAVPVRIGKGSAWKWRWRDLVRTTQGNGV